MKIHELNNFSGTLGAGSFLAVDDGNDTGKVSTQQVLAATEARIDNIIAGPAPSAQEVTDARRGADGVTYSSLGTAIRTQVTDLKSDINFIAEAVPTIFEQGEIGVDYGVLSPTTIRTRAFLNPYYKEYKISIDSGYSFLLFKYDMLGTYIGALHTDGTYSKSLSNLKLVTNSTYELFANDNERYCLQVKKNDDGAITPSDTEQIIKIISNKNANVMPSNIHHSGDILRVANDAIITATADDSVVYHSGKNMLCWWATPDGSDTVSSVAYTKSNGVVTVAGTASARANINIITTNNRKPIKAGKYTLSGCPKGGSNQTYRITIGITDVGEYSDDGDGVTFTVASDTTYYMKITVYSGTTINAQFKPQLELGAEVTDYELPYYERYYLNNGDSAIIHGYENSTNIIYCDNTVDADYYIGKGEVSLKECGAIGDGTHDDSDIINEALTLATGGTLFVPTGIYLFSKTLNVHTNTTIKGEGHESILQCDYPCTFTAISWRPDMTSAYHYRYSMILFDEDCDGCVLSNFALNGQTNTFKDQNEDGITIRGTNHKCENLKVTNINYFPDSFSSRTCITPAYGINAFNAVNVAFANLNMYHNGYENIGFENAESVVCVGGRFGDCPQTKVQIHRSCKHIFLNGLTIYNIDPDNKRGGITVDADPLYESLDLHFDNCSIYGSIAFVAGGENDVFINGCYLESGAISCNDVSVYRKRYLISNNNIRNGRIRIAVDECIIHDNMINTPTAEGVYYMITVFGNSVNLHDNMAIGDISQTNVIAH